MLFPILESARACGICESQLPLGPRPLLAAHPCSRILIVGQAPGRRTHEKGIPWADLSGGRLRQWLGLSEAQFYDATQVALLPMGFCYPGTGKSGDLPPRPECAPLWHPQILPWLKQRQLTIYLGRFAVERYLGGRYVDLGAAVEDYAALLPEQIVLPHPSPRNAGWVRQRPWFEKQLLPLLRERVTAAIGN